MYRNLKAEMARRGITNERLAKGIGVNPAAVGNLPDWAIDQHKCSGGITYMDADRAAALAHCASLPQLLSVHAHNLFESRKSSQNNDSVQSSR